MSFLKRLKLAFSPSKSEQHPERPIRAELPEKTQNLIFNAFGSVEYDSVRKWIEVSPDSRAIVLSYNAIADACAILEAAGMHRDDSLEIVRRFVFEDISYLRFISRGQSYFLKRFIVCAVEFEARIVYTLRILERFGFSSTDIIPIWMELENQFHKQATRKASLFKTPISLSLARDGEWGFLENSAKSRTVVWCVLNSSEVFGALINRAFEIIFDVKSYDVLLGLARMSRLAWLSYMHFTFKKYENPAAKSLTKVIEDMVDEKQLDIFGFHVVNTMRMMFEKTASMSEIYNHFAELYSNVSTSVLALDNENSDRFFKESNLLEIATTEVQFIQQLLHSDFAEEDVNKFCQNLNGAIFKSMGKSSNLEYSTFV